MSASGPKADKILLTKEELEIFPVLCEKLAKNEWSHAKVNSFFRSKTKSDEQYKILAERFKQYIPVYNEMKLERLAKERNEHFSHRDELEARKDLLQKRIEKAETDVVQIRSDHRSDIIASAQGDKPKHAPR